MGELRSFNRLDGESIGGQQAGGRAGAAVFEAMPLGAMPHEIQPRRCGGIGHDAGGIDPFAVPKRAEFSAKTVIPETCRDGACRAEPRGGNGDIGDVPAKSLTPSAAVDLVELHERLADADDVTVAHQISGCCAAGRGW